MKRSPSRVDATHETLDAKRVLEAKCHDTVARLRRKRPKAFAAVPLGASQLAPAVTLNAAQTRSLYSTAFAHAAAPGKANAEQVVWVDGESELLVRANKVRVIFRDGFALVGIPVFSEQSGEAEVVVSFAVGRPDAPMGLVMATETVPRGPTVVVEKWGEQLVAAAWTALVQLSSGIAAAAGIDDQNQPLLPAALVAHSKGITVIPQARHAIDR